MKKTVFYISLATLALAACQKTQDVPATQKGVTTLTFGIDNEATKTDLAGTVNILWSAGDKIAVETASDGVKEFTLIGEGGTASGTFATDKEVTAKPGGTAFYPSDLNPAYITDAWHVELPDSYSWNENGIQAPMYAWLNGGYNYFRLLTSVLKVDVYNIPPTADKLVFTTFAEAVSGDFTFAGDCLSKKADSGSNKSITISFTAGEKTTRTFFIPVPHGTYTAGATFVLKNSSNEAVVTKTAPALSVGKQKITFLPAINCTAAGVSTEIFKGSHDVANWSGTAFAHGTTFTAGDILRFTFSLDETVGGTPAGYWQLWLGYNTPWTEILTFGIPAGITTMDLILSSEQAASLNAHAEMAISGYAVTVTKIEKVPAQAETILWSGSVDFGDWANSFNEAGLNSAAIWSNLSTGKQLSIYYTPSASSGELHIKTASGWTDITGLSTNTASGSNHITFTLTSTQVEAIQAAGIVMQGSNITITKITLK